MARVFQRARPLSAAGLGLLALIVFVRPGGEAPTRAADDLLGMLFPLAAGAAVLYAARAMEPAARKAWRLIGWASLIWGSGEVAWAFYEIVLGVNVPFPSLADVGYLGSVPLFVAGVLWLAPARLPAAGRGRLLVDGLILAGGLLALSWTTVLGTVFRESDGGLLKQVLALAYPVSDVVLVSVVLSFLAPRINRRRPDLLLLAAGLLLNAAADSAFAYLTAVGSYQTGGAADLAWAGGYALIGLAALDSPGRVAPQEPRRQSALSALLVFAPLVPGVLLIRLQAIATGRIDPVVVALGLALFFLVITRQVLLDLENQALERARARTVSELEGTERHLQEVIRSAPVAIFATDASGAFTVCEGSVWDRLRGRAGELVGRRLSDAIGPDHELNGLFARALAGQSGVLNLTEDERDLEVRVSPVCDESGRVVGLSGVAIDVSPERAADLARRESEAKDRFLASMSHELRTPLNSILGFAQMLEMQSAGPLTDKQQRYLGHISSSGRHLLSLINEVLDLAKVSAGQIDVDLRPLAVSGALEDAVENVRPLAESAGLDLEIQADPGLQAVADARRLDQVLLNLLSNAIKFTPAGGHVRLEARQVGGSVVIAVTDTGAGISEDDRERIFDEFTQLEQGRTRGRQGTGLGLALSRRLARLMGGELSVESSLGSGSSFLLELPAVRSRVAV